MLSFFKRHKRKEENYIDSLLVKAATYKEQARFLQAQLEEERWKIGKKLKIMDAMMSCHSPYRDQNWYEIKVRISREALEGAEKNDRLVKECLLMAFEAKLADLLSRCPLENQIEELAHE